MIEISNELSLAVFHYESLLKKLNENTFSQRPAPGKWSKKEELGHLIDSAQNNLRRFIVCRYEINPRIVYRQDEWVAASGYHNLPSENLIQLWVLLNLQICSVLKSFPDELKTKTCDTGHEKTELKTIEWLAADYIPHLKHHMHHLHGLEPVEYR